MAWACGHVTPSTERQGNYRHLIDILQLDGWQMWMHVDGVAGEMLLIFAAGVIIHTP